MNVTWTGKQEFFHPKQKDQLDAKFAKIGHLLEVDGKGDKQARVALSQDKNKHRAEVTLEDIGFVQQREPVIPGLTGLRENRFALHRRLVGRCDRFGHGFHLRSLFGPIFRVRCFSLFHVPLKQCPTREAVFARQDPLGIAQLERAA